MCGVQEAELQRLRQARAEELKYLQEKNKLEVQREMEVADIAVKKFKGMMESIGADTIRDIALAGPELQVTQQQTYILLQSPPISPTPFFIFLPIYFYFFPPFEFCRRFSIFVAHQKREPVTSMLMPEFEYFIF